MEPRQKKILTEGGDDESSGSEPEHEEVCGHMLALPGQDGDDGREEGHADCAEVPNQDRHFRRHSVDIRRDRGRHVGRVGDRSSML